ncbi:MAG: sporulation protein YabP [Dethiobacter sp.]|jgi:sporulation protein YabP|nr:MAG: sporulation protein YabP [Dethiobacter sp.]
MEDSKYSSKQPGRHRLVVDSREKVEVTGVLNVDSFDDQEIILETEQGLLAMRGEDLHIKHLNLEQGELTIEGFLLEFAYSEERSIRLKDRGKSFFERLFK